MGERNQGAGVSGTAVKSDTGSDKALVQRAGLGDRDAFAELLDRHYPLIYRTAFKWCGHQSDAEDIAQEVALKLVGILDKFDGRAAFTTWLYRVTLNAVRDMQRRRSREANRDGELQHLTQDTVAAEQENATTEGELWRAVRALPEKQRDAVLLIYAEELSHAAAAKILEVRESTVSWYVHEARKNLKGLLS